jgi:hypothetical protein
MNLPNYPLKVEMRTIQNAEDLIRDLLDKFSRPLRYIPDGPMIWIRALKNKEDRWHDYSPAIHNKRDSSSGNSLFSTVIHGEKYRWLDRQLENVPQGNWKDKKTLERIQKLSDSYQVNYNVRRQFERGLYFDTASGELAKKNVALRVKQWSPADNNGVPSSAPTTQMLFVKITAPKGESDEAFHLRTEYQVPIPIGYGTVEAAAIGRALLEHLGIHLSQQDTIAPIKEVRNLRYGFDLVRGRTRNGIRKIGFITVDTFSVKSLDTGKISSTINQMEVEILPKYQALKDDKDLSDFFKVLDARYNVKVSTTPKYLQ